MSLPDEAIDLIAKSYLTDKTKCNYTRIDNERNTLSQTSAFFVKKKKKCNFVE